MCNTILQLCNTIIPCAITCMSYVYRFPFLLQSFGKENSLPPSPCPPHPAAGWETKGCRLSQELIWQEFTTFQDWRQTVTSCRQINSLFKTICHRPSRRKDCCSVGGSYWSFSHKALILLTVRNFELSLSFTTAGSLHPRPPLCRPFWVCMCVRGAESRPRWHCNKDAASFFMFRLLRLPLVVGMWVNRHN